MMRETVLISIPLTSLQTLIIDSVNACLDIRANNNLSPSQFISPQEAADILHTTLPTLQSWTSEGKVKSYCIGKDVLYKKNEIERAITTISTNSKTVKQ